jgi:hypothetical protein
MQLSRWFCRAKRYATLSATYRSKRNSKRLWKSVENLDDSHAAEMVQTPGFLAALGMTEL